MQFLTLINSVALFVALVSANIPNPLYRGSGSPPADVKKAGGFHADVACPAGGCTAETVHDHTLDILKPRDPLISTSSKQSTAENNGGYVYKIDSTKIKNKIWDVKATLQAAGKPNQFTWEAEYSVETLIPWSAITAVWEEEDDGKLKALTLPKH